MLTLSGTQFAPIGASKTSCVAPGFRRIPFQASCRISYPASFEAERPCRLTTATGTRIHPHREREAPKLLGHQTCRKRRGATIASSHKSGTWNLEAPLALATD